ncbi:MAG: hypothetical protein ACRD15_07680, partial [Vicinamibacterales bacterium]
FQVGHLLVDAHPGAFDAVPVAVLHFTDELTVLFLSYFPPIAPRFANREPPYVTCLPQFPGEHI